MQYVKWVISFVKSRGVLSHEIYHKVFGFFLSVVQTQDSTVFEQYLPQFSSVATKILTNDYKLNHSEKIQVIEIWQITLLKYFEKRALKKYEKKVTISLKPVPEPKMDETLMRLGDCFKFICQNMHKMQEPQVIKRFKTFCQKLLSSGLCTSHLSLNAKTDETPTLWILYGWQLSQLKLKQLLGEKVNSTNLSRKMLKFQTSSSLSNSVIELFFE